MLLASHWANRRHAAESVPNEVAEFATLSKTVSADTPRSPNSRFRKGGSHVFGQIAGPVAVALAYFATAKCGEWLAFPSAPVSALWAPNAILLAGLILSARNRWWLYFLAVVPLHVLAQASSTPPSQVAIQYFANCLEALLGALAIRSLNLEPLRFDRLKSALALIVFAALLAPLITSYLMATAFQIAGLGNHVGLTTVARTVTNSFATLTLVPAITHTAEWLRQGHPPISWKRVLELAVLFAAVVAVGNLLFVTPYAGYLSPAFLFAPLPFLLWATVRFGVPGVSASVLLLGVLSVWGVLNGNGPFSEQDPVHNALPLVLLLVFTCIPLLLLSGVLEERKAATHALSQAESLHSAVLASLHDQIAVLDRRGVIVETNASWCAFAEQEEVNALNRAWPGENFLQICATAARQGDQVAAQVHEATAGVLQGSPTQHQIEFPVVSKAGMRWFDISIEPLRRAEGGAVVTRADITTRKRAESDANTQQRELAHMGRAAVLGELSGAFAHELNQPLASILGNAEAGLVLCARGLGSSAEVRAILQDIVTDDIRAAQLIQRLRDLLAKGERQRQPVDLNVAVREVIDLLRSDLIARNVSVEVRPDAQTPVISGDRVQIQQLILNLVMNACEAMADMPSSARKLTVETRWLVSSRCVEMSVADQGHGITMQPTARIFDPFITTKEHGLGLGLAICCSIADAHGGRLSAENVPTGGAIFRFSVPIEGGGPHDQLH
jgi:two-component system, LuxR family, sensor kinase FixL